ncbi:MAG: cation transporter [candidate division Zixibacteria bacterium]|nr:cation transporter [candidate division Zixibacteria bacterium]
MLKTVSHLTADSPGTRRADGLCLWVGLGSNVLLAIAKLAAALASQSQALLADGLNSLLDVVAGTISLVGFRVAAKPPDRDHHYGHQNAETLAALAVGVAILAAGGIIIRDAAVSLWHGAPRVPSAWAAAVAAGVIVVKMALYLYSRTVARRTGNLLVRATAADHISDVVATGGAFVGIAGARLGWPVLDPLAAVWVACVILVSALRILRANTFVLLGGAPSESTIRQITATLSAVPGVRGLHRTKVRTAGTQIVVDTEVLVDGTLTVDEAHRIANAAGDQVLASHPSVADVIVHVEPHTEKRAAEGPDPLTPRAHPRPGEAPA